MLFHGGNMKIGYRVLLMVFLFPLVLFAAEEAKQNVSQGKPEEVAVASAQQWLKIIDAGKYAEGWESASEYLKNAVPRDAFIQSLQGVRKPLGKMKNRTLSLAQYTTRLPGAPDGEYVVIQFKTEFENKAAAIETITPHKEKDGQWRTSGYYIN
jgi:hypothetical protein